MSLELSIKNSIRNIPDFPKPGIQFKDITPVFYDQHLCTRITQEFAHRIIEKPDAVVGIESRGFLFGFMLANLLNVPFILVRKAGKLPYKKISLEYALEYGKAVIEIHEDAIQKGWKVLIHDDLLATGGTAAAAATIVEKMGATVMGFNFLVSLDFLNGKDKLVPHTNANNITCLVHY